MKQNLSKIAFTFYLLCLVCNSMNSQTTSTDNNMKLLRKNIFHVSLAPDVAYNAVHVFYDRIIYEKNNIAAFARVGYGGWHTLLVNSGTIVVGQGGLIIGTQNGRFEAAVGAGFMKQTQYSSAHDKTVPAINIGYRSQKCDKHFVFRTGIGYPEGIYGGFGYAL